MFGPNWRSNYEEHLLFADGNGFLEYVRADGSVWYFGAAGLSPNVYKAAAPAIDTSTTVTEGSPNWTVTFKSGEKRQFDATTGALMAIVDRNGNTTSLTYDSSHRLTTVTDAAGRHLNFTYASPSSNLVTGVSSDVGISLSYAYDASGRLSVVTKPDNTTVSFDYNPNSMITAVRDNEGKVLESHTYDVSNRGLSSSRANGVDSVTVTYP
jgi:YD repeat-containing protein